ncbi:hypothetical protein Tco_0233293 [Tanacetum coccineum]
MTTLADKSLLSGGDNKPPMLEKHLYDSWKSRMELYMLNRPHGRMVLASVEKGPLVWPSITVEGVTRLKEYTKLTPAEAIQADCDIKAINIILQGLPTEIYALKYGFESCDPVDTPMVEKSKLDEDKEGKAIDLSHYHGMIGSLLYLTASRPDLQFVICMCTRQQAFANADHAGCQDTRRSTSGSIQLLGDRLVSWSSKRQKSATISSTEAEYIALITDITKDDQIALDDALVAPADRLKIGKCNLRLSSDVTSKEATLQVVYDVLKLTRFYKAFQVSADVPEIYMQEFWASAYIHNRSKSSEDDQDDDKNDDDENTQDDDDEA